MTMHYAPMEASHLAKAMAERGLTEAEILKAEPVMVDAPEENERIWREIVAAARGA
ncbi:hypothetical protein [Bradyrhizobium sp. USDA 4452]